ncbi:hypothetical protein RIF29_15761 [Crotalaria pallida]|uniref:Uncharacterized protein n=1 Tax=Crotalaria pallida TaxID=3830 RepID=A0AAN9FE54_CROPI
MLVAEATVAVGPLHSSQSPKVTLGWELGNQRRRLEANEFKIVSPFFLSFSLSSSLTLSLPMVSLFLLSSSLLSLSSSLRHFPFFFFFFFASLLLPSFILSLSLFFSSLSPSLSVAALSSGNSQLLDFSLSVLLYGSSFPLLLIYDGASSQIEKGIGGLMGSVQSIARTAVELLMWSRLFELLIKGEEYE